MNEVKHTPGPWKANPFDIERRTVGVWGGAPSPHLTYIATVCATLHGARNDDAARANARLIEAAPDLLAALRGLMDMYGIEPARSKSGTWKRALDAVARAEGKP